MLREPLRPRTKIKAGERMEHIHDVRPDCECEFCQCVEGHVAQMKRMEGDEPRMTDEQIRRVAITLAQMGGEAD